MKKVMGSLALLVAVSLTCAVYAEDEKIEVVLSGLKNPCGIAVQKDTGHVFVSDTAAGRVFRVVDGEAEDVVSK